MSLTPEEQAELIRLDREATGESDESRVELRLSSLLTRLTFPDPKRPDTLRIVIDAGAGLTRSEHVQVLVGAVPAYADWIAQRCAPEYLRTNLFWLAELIKATRVYRAHLTSSAIPTLEDFL